VVRVVSYLYYYGELLYQGMLMNGCLILTYKFRTNRKDLYFILNTQFRLQESLIYDARQYPIKSTKSNLKNSNLKSNWMKRILLNQLRIYSFSLLFMFTYYCEMKENLTFYNNRMFNDDQYLIIVSTASLNVWFSFFRTVPILMTIIHTCQLSRLLENLKSSLTYDNLRSIKSLDTIRKNLNTILAHHRKFSKLIEFPLFAVHAFFVFCVINHTAFYFINGFMNSFSEYMISSLALQVMVYVWHIHLVDQASDLVSLNVIFLSSKDLFFYRKCKWYFFSV